MSTMRGLAAAGIVLALAGGATAQVAPPRDPNMPAPHTVPPEKIAPNDDTTGSTGSTSETLRRNEGVITPPPTGNDGGVVKPAPDAGTTPVITPRGGAGDTVQPK